MQSSNPAESQQALYMELFNRRQSQLSKTTRTFYDLGKKVCGHLVGCLIGKAINWHRTEHSASLKSGFRSILELLYAANLRLSRSNSPVSGQFVALCRAIFGNRTISGCFT
jgi:hypothetical protein